MKNGISYEIHPCIDPSINFTQELWRHEIIKALKNMSAQSIWHRFAAGLHELSEEQLDYLTDIDGKNRVAWCAAIIKNDDLTGIGVSRFARLTDQDNTAEFAITVIDKFQGQGVGRALLEQLMRSAKDNQIKTLRGYVLPGNAAMLALCAHLNASIEQEDDHVKVELSL